MLDNFLLIFHSKKVKTFLVIFCLLFLYVFISAISYVNAVSSNIQNNVFRLHVIANSDSTEDQNLKYKVRDAILAHVNEIGKSAQSKEQLISMLNIEELTQIAKQAIADNGFDYDVSVEIGNFPFPTKIYGDISLPSGFYDALRIKIGSASGQNWWCVMFPPLCFVDISSGIVPEQSKETFQSNMDTEEYKLISESDNTQINFKFKLIEIFQNLNTQLASKK